MEPTPPAAAPRRQWSITARLVTLYVVSTTALLLLSFGALYLSMRGKVEDEDVRYLGEQLGLMRVLLAKTPAGGKELFQRLEWDQQAHTTLHFLARILDEGGRMMAETPRMAALLPPDVFPAPGATAPENGHWRTGNGGRYLLAAEWADPTPDRTRLRLQVALDQSGDEAMLSGLRQKIFFIVAVGALASAGLGAWVARRALRPLRAITEAAAAVSATQLRTRVAATGWPRELASLADAFDGMLARLEESFTRLSNFSGDLSHELRTPINNLRGEAEVALARARTAEEYREVLESGLEEYHRLGRLIENLLFLARAESAELSVRTEPLDVRRELQAVAEFYEAAAEEQGVTLRWGGEAVMRSDSVLFRRMVGNLLDNALRHTPRGGHIELAAGLRPGRGVEVEVRDDGEGIAPEHLGRVFDRFYRGEPRAPGGSKGFGLGLAIVKSIMLLHGGSVALDSTPGRGTRVVLTFPNTPRT